MLKKATNLVYNAYFENDESILLCGMYPTYKVAISQHLAAPRFPQCDHTVSKLSVDTAVHWFNV